MRRRSSSNRSASARPADARAVADAGAFSLVSEAVAEPLDHWLKDQEDRSIRAWMRTCGVRMVAVEGAFYNINTPEALSLAEAALSGVAQSR